MYHDMPYPLDASISPRLVEDLFRIMLKREVGNDNYAKERASIGDSLRDLIAEIRNSEELRDLACREGKLKLSNPESFLSPLDYRVPRNISYTKTIIEKVLVVGSCLMENWAFTVQRFSPETKIDVYLLGSLLPEYPQEPVESYQFQVIQLPLRSVLPDLGFARLNQTDLDAHQALFDQASDRALRILDEAMRWNKSSGILSYLIPFPVPQQNMVGRLMPRYDLRNPVYFVEMLNRYVYNEFTKYKNAYLIDYNEISTTHGKRSSYEDHIALFNHGGIFCDFDFAHDQNRIEPAQKASDIYKNDVEEMHLMVWNEMIGLYRSVHQIDSVKMVVIDLDDTLWRGIIGEADVHSLPTNEGWPRGFWEALAILKRRGILLGIISKNEESRVREVWDTILGRNTLRLEDFAVRRINWRPKSENMAEILDAVNLLPHSVVFIDDNPAQREDIQKAFPGLRVLGGTPLMWRHVLLWAAETQQATITAESAARTEMVQKQVEREAQRKTMSNEEFLLSLDVRMHVFPVESVEHPRFGRVIELVNKTNQFNTTGKRWAYEECVAEFSAGTKFYAFDVSDKFTDYGLVGVLIVGESEIKQFVMSCRIMGLGAELAAVAFVTNILRQAGAREVKAAMVHTERNLPCRNVYERCGFQEAMSGWLCLPEHQPLVPGHISLVTS